jgi:20S proteasome alpha/beta subunit
MTAIVGILCSDGVVIGADSSSTSVVPMGERAVSLIEQETEKIHIIGRDVILAGCGSVGMGQRFIGIAEEAYRAKLFQKDRLEVARALAETTGRNFESTAVPRSGYGALMAYTNAGRIHLCEFGMPNFQPEFKTDKLWFVSIGSGQFITDPFLGLLKRVFCKVGLPTVADATFFATWTLKHVIELNAGGINEPIRLACIKQTPDGKSYFAEHLSEAAHEEHENFAEEAERHLANFKLQAQEANASPPIPSPPAGPKA